MARDRCPECERSNGPLFRGPCPHRRQAFVAGEGRAMRRFMDRHANADFQAPRGSTAVYRRQYRCKCGFTTTDPGALFDHVLGDFCAPPKKRRPR